MSPRLLGPALSLLLVPVAFGDASVPTSDLPGAKDSPLLPRYQGSFLVGYESKAYDALTLPLAPLEELEGQRDGHNNLAFAPKESKALEGARTRLVYAVPEGRSPLEVLRNYQEAIAAKGGRTLFECSGAGCGGDPGRSSEGGGGRMSLAMVLKPEEGIGDPPFSNGYCAQTGRISDQRYAVAELPEGRGYASILTYTLQGGSFCKALDGRTIAVVDVLETKPREQRMEVVKAEEMASKMADAGSVALYGIHFDFNKSAVKPESAPTLAEIGRLLKSDPKLKLLVVGHTDNVGTLAFNMALSQHRAEAVVAALVSGQGVDRDRLTPMGVAFAAPVASNATEEGRARNRRVELVPN